MRKSILLLIIILGLTSCKDDFNYDSLHNESKLVVYCFPSGADTTYISVSNSLGVNQLSEEMNIRSLHDARVSYEINGEPQDVRPTGGDIHQGTFYVVGSHHSGDIISIRVEHEGYASVSGSTTIPQPVAVSLDSVRTVMEYDPDWEGIRTFHQLRASFTDPSETEDFYAVRVCVEGYEKDIWNASSQRYYTRTWPQIETLDEPLLKKTSDLDADFGFYDDYYAGFYIFNDHDINGKTYTLRLNLDAWDSDISRLEDRRYRVILYRLSPEYYRFMESINNKENNELAQNGLAQLSPTFSNIRGGIGIMGAYWEAYSQWMKLKDETINE